jgi:hypothetical protein
MAKVEFKFPRTVDIDFDILSESPG